MRTRERAPRPRFPADTPDSAPARDSSGAPRECGQRSNHWLCGPAWALPLPLPSLPKGQEGQDGARGVSRVNRLGAAGVWSSGERDSPECALAVTVSSGWGFSCRCSRQGWKPLSSSWCPWLRFP